jgi:DNA-binding CsgD family transcriptional regulator
LDGAAGHATSVVPSLALAWIEGDDRARLLVTDSLDILWANDAGKSALAARRDLESRDGQLTATSPGHQEQLADFVRAAKLESSTLALPSEDGRGHLVLRAQHLGHHGSASHVGLQFFRSHHRAFDYADFEKVFGLTRAEHQVLRLMLDGKTADEVSGEKQVSIDTVRSQIRQIYDKLGVSSREGLFRRIRPYIL